MAPRVVFMCVAGAVGMAGCTRAVLPRGELFVGKVGGCGSWMVYRLDASRRLAVAVHVQEKRLALGARSAVLDLAADGEVVRVEVERFSGPAEERFCNDVVGRVKEVELWRGISGKVVFERGAEKQNGIHWVSVRLEGVEVRREGDGATAVLDEVEMCEVRVGWLAG